MARASRAFAVVIFAAALAAPAPAVLAVDEPGDSELTITHITKAPDPDGPYKFAAEIENTGTTEVELPRIVVTFLDADGGVADERSRRYERVLAPGDRFVFDGAALADDGAVDVRLEFEEPPTPFGESKITPPLEVTDAFFVERPRSTLAQVTLSDESFVTDDLEFDAVARVRNTSERPVLLDEDVKIVWYDSADRIVDVDDARIRELREKALMPGQEVAVGPFWFARSSALTDERPISFAMELVVIDSPGEWLRATTDDLVAAKVTVGEVSLVEDGLGKTYASTYVENVGDRDAVLKGAYARMRDGTLRLVDLPPMASRGMVQSGRMAVLPPRERIPIRFQYRESNVGEGAGATLTEVFTVAVPALESFATEAQIREVIAFGPPDPTNAAAVELTTSSAPVEVVNEHHHGGFMVAAHMAFDSAQGPWVADWSIERPTPFDDVPEDAREAATYQPFWMPDWLEGWTLTDEYLQLLCEGRTPQSFSHCRPWQLLDAGEVISHECDRDGEIILNVTPPKNGLRAPGWEVSPEGDTITLSAERLANDTTVEFNEPYRVAYELVDGPMLVHEFVIDCLYYEALVPEPITAPPAYFEAVGTFLVREEPVEELNRQAGAAADEAALDALLVQAAEIRADNLEQLATDLGAVSFPAELQALVDEVIEAARLAADAARRIAESTGTIAVEDVDYANEAQDWFQLTLDDLEDRVSAPE